MNSTKYAVRFFDVHTINNQQHLELAREVQVHRLINAVILLSCSASILPLEAKPQIAKFFVRERGVYREIQPSDWVAETHDMARIADLGLS